MADKKPGKTEKGFLNRKINESGAIKDLIIAHNQIQDDTDALIENINLGFDEIKKELKEQVEQLNKRFSEGETAFKQQETRLTILEQDKKLRDQRNGQRDNEIKNLDKKLNKNLDDIKVEMKEMQKSISLNTTERRNENSKLSEKIEEANKSLYKRLNNDRTDGLKFNAYIIGATMSIIIPILVAIIYLLFNHIGGGR